MTGLRPYDPGVEAPDFILLPAATFEMGNALGRKDEQPTRNVSLAPFRAARAPVTNAQYDEFVAGTGRRVSQFRDDARFNDAVQPVVGISWHDAVAYCAWLSDECGVACRLPSESEREFASLGGLDGSNWPWGAEPPGERPELAAIAALDQPHEPTPACANGYGLRCMAENVHEWCGDWYDRDAYQSAIEERPGGPESGTRKVCRGGSWRHSVKFTRLSARASLAPKFHYNDFGFRVYADG